MHVCVSALMSCRATAESTRTVLSSASARCSSHGVVSHAVMSSAATNCHRTMRMIRICARYLLRVEQLVRAFKCITVRRKRVQ